MDKKDVVHIFHGILLSRQCTTHAATWMDLEIILSEVSQAKTNICLCMIYSVISLICDILKNYTKVDFNFHDHNIISFSFKTGYQVSFSTLRCTAFLSISGNDCQITSVEHSAIWGRGTPKKLPLKEFLHHQKGMQKYVDILLHG